MGERRHFLSAINEQGRTGVCAVCGPVALKTKGFKDGRRLWRCRLAWEAQNNGRGTRRDGLSRLVELRGAQELGPVHLARVDAEHDRGVAHVLAGSDERSRIPRVQADEAREALDVLASEGEVLQGDSFDAGPLGPAPGVLAHRRGSFV